MTNLVQIRYLGYSCNYLQPVLFIFDLPLILRNKKRNDNMEFYKHDQLFYCYVITLAEETAKKVLLSVVWNPLLIEINLSQIRTLEIKREKVCVVCPYHLLFFHIIKSIHFLTVTICECLLVLTHCTITRFGFRVWGSMALVWSIFDSHTAWADQITCGTSICIGYWRKFRLRWLYV